MMELLKAHRVLICAGTGGVGKTSISASLGVLAARSGLRVLVLTIDPAQRLAQSLGIESRPGDAVGVKGIPGLTATMIDARREFDEFVLGSVDSGVAKGLFHNRLYQQLASNLSGSQEFTSLVRLMNAVKAEQYDLVILDTPPTQNAVDFLKAPDRLYALFQDSVMSWFATPEQREGFIKRTLHRGTRLVTAALETVTGSTFIQELKDFFVHVSHLRGRVAEVSRGVNELLRAPTTGFILISGFDETKLKEALEFQQDLRAENLRLCGVIVNRWFPEWVNRKGEWPEAWEKDPDFLTLKDFYAQFSQFFSLRQEIFSHFVNQLGDDVPVVKLPDFSHTVQGLDDLKMMADIIVKKWETHE